MTGGQRFTLEKVKFSEEMVRRVHVRLTLDLSIGLWIGIVTSPTSVKIGRPGTSNDYMLAHAGPRTDLCLCEMSLICGLSAGITGSSFLLATLQIKSKIAFLCLLFRNKCHSSSDADKSFF